ncbi:MAG TPA: cyclopropane-fatty-acyl-phospholipid synthase family protein [Trinickia sp.]|uniref:cyclopropane-fatty-acyl-phospholipid synthase family protein n=1 Tax=Trinickia sp. TaxID=2571163 RepID=UPI002C55E9BE|nr:cyclopropane-fatty-acyl-phospholipid synthase family protein [Trinickia sp.]HVW52134.1 cyclopropane-fatty-acyl-phospholipid synthase family protein [Trinickia sp.]
MPASARIFLALLDRLRIGHLVVDTPDGSQRLFGQAQAQPGAQLALRDWRACALMLRAGDIGFAQAYREGWVDSQDLSALLRLALLNENAMPQPVVGGMLARAWYRLRHWTNRNTKAGSRHNVHAHYDLGNAFYALWLDPGFTYSSALFEGDAHRSLEAAQSAKYQRIVDRLGLRPGMRVLEIGCGWGGFALHAARQGIHVHGITLSTEQLDYARTRVHREGLTELISLELRDYREVHGRYDAVVSIEMFEAVGEAFWRRWFAVVRRCLADGARSLVQTITIDERRFPAYRASSDFIREYIFPGGMLPSAERFVSQARQAGLRAQRSLAFGSDYARTLRGWRENFEANVNAVRAQGFDEVFIRTWRLYLAYCEAGFAEGRTDVMHFELEPVDHEAA